MTDTTILHDPHEAGTSAEADVQRVLVRQLAKLDRNVLFYLACALEGHPRVRHLTHQALRNLLTDSELHARLHQPDAELEPQA